MAHIYDISSEEIRIVARVVGLLAANRFDGDLRAAIFPDIMRLMRADVMASFVWDNRANAYALPFLINQDPANVDRYQNWYQFRDPVTKRLKHLQRPACVDEVMTKDEFQKTEIYNDFLAKDGMYHGANLFTSSGGKDLADLRIWRNKSRVAFGARELDLLSILAPHLERALLRAPETSLSDLTPRERDVALLIARGCSDKDIARICGIGFATVRTHVGRALAKLECSNRAELSALVERLTC